jgi:DNA adenine methylase
MSAAAIRSPLRYPGGKTRAISKIMPLVPGNIQEFREPFVGGGSVLFAMVERFGVDISTYWINDLNRDLICFWQVARDNNTALVKAISRLKSEFSDGRLLYNHLRQPENISTDFDRAVRFFIMNRITFSGVMDSGGYSPTAFKGRFTASSIERLSLIDVVLQSVNITQVDYTAVVQAPGEDVFIFLDPPYYSATDSRLYGVRGNLHTSFDHARFADVMRQCQHRWLLTYDDSDYIRDLFSFADIRAWELQYGMNNYKQGKAAKGNEIFIKNY